MNELFEGTVVFEKCEGIMEAHRAMKTIGLIYNEYDFNSKNGNAFSGNIHRNWFKSIIEEMILTQFDKLNQIIDIYNQEQKKLGNG